MKLSIKLREGIRGFVKATVFFLALLIPFLLFPGGATGAKPSREAGPKVLLTEVSETAPKAQFKTITDNVCEAAGGTINIIIPVDWPYFTKEPFFMDFDMITADYTGLVAYSSTDETYFIYYMAIGTPESYRLIVYGLFGKDTYLGMDTGDFPKTMTEEAFNKFNAGKKVEAVELNAGINL